MNALFDYKSVVGALVQVKGDAENKKELYMKNLEVLDPQVERVRFFVILVQEKVKMLTIHNHTIVVFFIKDA